MNTQMTVGMAIQILSGSPVFKMKCFSRREKVELARDYCNQWDEIKHEQENKKLQQKSN